MKSIIFKVLSVFTLSAFVNSSFANSDSDQQNLACVSKSELKVNGIPYLGKSKQIADTLGKPKRIRSFLYDSGGNSGRYKLTEMSYNGAVFVVNNHRISQSGNEIERIIVTGRNYRIVSNIYIGDSKTKVMQTLGIHSEKDMLSVDEAEQIQGDNITNSLPMKKGDWSLSTCDNDSVTSVNFYFDSFGHLIKFTVFFDDGAI